MSIRTGSRKYQLALQFPATSINDYDAMIELENMIINSLGVLGEVDGHDAGVNEMNIFIHTDHPEQAFERVISGIGTKEFMPELKAAFREIGTDIFTVLYPAGLKCFSIA